MAVAGADGCIFQHGLQTEFIVYSFQTFYESIGYYDFSIRTALGTTIAVTATGVGHVAVSFVDVDKWTDDVCFTFRVYQGDEWSRSAVSVPDGVEVIVIRFVICP